MMDSWYSVDFREAIYLAFLFVWASSFRFGADIQATFQCARRLDKAEYESVVSEFSVAFLL